MARLDSTGVTPRDLAGYRELFQQRFRDAFGAGLAFDEETPQAQWVGIAALSAAEIDEIFVADANALAISRGAGFQLDSQGELLNVERLRRARSTVTVSLDRNRRHADNRRESRPHYSRRGVPHTR